MIRLDLASIGMVEETGSVILVLRAPEQARLLVMEIGILEGRAIALEAEGIRTPRPLTHELLHKVIERLGGNVTAVQIRDFRDKTFFANLVLERAGDQLELDARPSDAIALALRSGAPIFATEQVLATAGIEEEEGETLLVDTDAEDEEDGEDGGNIVH